MGKNKPSIESERAALEAEYNEPLPALVAGFIPMGSTRRATAETLGVSFASFRRFCSQENIHFPSANERRRAGGYFAQESEADRRAKISRYRRRVGRQISFDGLTMSLSGWSDRTGIPATTIRSRIDAGKDLATALDMPGPGLRRTR